MMSNVAAARVRAVHLGGRRRSCSASRAGPSCRKPRDLAKIFDTRRIHQVAQLPRHRGLRASSTLTMPRALARLPYGAATKPIDEFDYEEAPFDAAGAAKPMDHDALLLDERRLRDGHAS